MLLSLIPLTTLYCEPKALNSTASEELKCPFTIEENKG
jgi:hypothetical protein